jgi:hypothetical protein
MAPIYREPFIAGVVIGCVALGFLLSALIFNLAQYYQQSNRVRVDHTLSRTMFKRKPSLGTYP